MKNTSRRTINQYSELYGPKKVVKHLQPYFLQGGKWHKLKQVKSAPYQFTGVKSNG